MLADQPRVKRSPEWFLGMAVATGAINGQFRTATLTSEDRPGLLEVPDGPTIGVVVRAGRRERYRIPCGLLASVYMVVSVDDFPQGRFPDTNVTKIVTIEGVISRKRLQAVYTPRSDEHFHVSATRLDSALAFGQWLRDNHGEKPADSSTGDA